MTDQELIDEIEAQWDLMAEVATGGRQINDVNPEYKDRRESIQSALKQRAIDDPNPFTDLWRWYGRWSKGEMPSYQSRREFISELYEPLLERLKERTHTQGAELFEEPTGWDKIDQSLDYIKTQLEVARTEEQFQAIGLLCREILISIAQTVYDVSLHESPDGVEPSKTDAKRMLEAYLAHELGGKTNEAARRHAKASLILANELQHKRTATFREAALCAEASTSVINLIAIISGQRDPQ